MADGALTRTITLTLDEDTALRLDQAARDAGLGDLIAEALVPDDLLNTRTEAARQWQDDQTRIALDEYERTGEGVPLEEALRTFRADVEAGLAAKVQI